MIDMEFGCFHKSIGSGRIQQQEIKLGGQVLVMSFGVLFVESHIAACKWCHCTKTTAVGLPVRRHVSWILLTGVLLDRLGDFCSRQVCCFAAQRLIFSLLRAALCDRRRGPQRCLCTCDGGALEVQEAEASNSRWLYSDVNLQDHLSQDFLEFEAAAPG